MNNGTNNFQNFIGISSLQKTLRNALIPTETTQQFIVKNGIIKRNIKTRDILHGHSSGSHLGRNQTDL